MYLYALDQGKGSKQKDIAISKNIELYNKPQIFQIFELLSILIHIVPVFSNFNLNLSQHLNFDFVNHVVKNASLNNFAHGIKKPKKVRASHFFEFKSGLPKLVVHITVVDFPKIYLHAYQEKNVETKAEQE